MINIDPITIILNIVIALLLIFVKRDLSASQLLNLESQKRLDERHKDIKAEVTNLVTCLTNMQKEITTKVDRYECKRELDEKWNRINHHVHVLVPGKEVTGGVVIPDQEGYR